MRHEMKIAREYHYKIRNGTKTVESRLFDKKRQRIAVGDEIVFRQNEDADATIVRKVKALHRYPSFHDLMTALPPAMFGWSKISGWYSEEEQEALGVVGIELERSK